MRRRFLFFFAEKGMSIIEVMVAVFMVFMALTSLVVLLGEAGRLNLNSKVNQLGSALAHQKMEWLKNLEFSSIGFLTPEEGEPGGILPRYETTTIGNLEFRVDYEIEWVDAPETENTTEDYKKVTVTVSWQKPLKGSAKVTSYISQAQRRSPGTIVNPPPPDIISPPTPAPDSEVEDVVPIQIGIDAPGYLFNAIEVRIGGGIDGRKDTVHPPSESCSMLFNWDTTSIEDGKYEILAIVYEARGGTSSRSWYYFVNNAPPTVSPTLEVVPGSVDVNSASLKWNIVYDGNEKILSYNLYRTLPFNQLIEIRPETGDNSVYYAENYVVKSFSGLSPWTPYSFYVKGYSHGDETPASNDANFTTKIKLEASSAKVSGKYKVTLNWTSAPDPSEIGSIKIYKKVGTGAWQTKTISYATSWEDTQLYQKTDTIQYRVEALGLSGEIVNESNIINVRF